MIVAGQNKEWGKTIEESTRYWLDVGVDHIMVKKAWDMPLITPKGDVIEENFSRLGRLQKEYGVRYHMHPYTLPVDIDGERHILDSFSDKINGILSRVVRGFDEQIQGNGLYPLMTMHMSAADYPGLNVKIDEATALKRSKDFFQSLNLGTTVDLEVVPDPYRIKGWSHLGCRPSHFTEVGSPKRYPMCLDTGHLNLNERPLDDFTKLGYPITSVHLHGNGGKADDHEIPSRANLKDYQAVESFLKGYDGIVVLEIRNHGYSKDDMRRLVENTKQRRIA
jgi:hypothetical protein